jgi:hypothetical protein
MTVKIAMMPVYKFNSFTTLSLRRGQGEVFFA